MCEWPGQWPVVQGWPQRSLLIPMHHGPWAEVEKDGLWHVMRGHVMLHPMAMAGAGGGLSGVVPTVRCPGQEWRRMYQHAA